MANGFSTCEIRLELVQNKTPDMHTVWMLGHQNQPFRSENGSCLTRLLISVYLVSH